MILALTRENLIGPVIEDWFRREPLFAGSALISALICIPLMMAMGLDDRTYLDINIWIKPLKFSASIAVYLGTLAWFAGWLPKGMRETRWYRVFAAVTVICAALELAWIYGAAAFGVGSHFNISTPFMAAAYSAAGVVVMILMLSAPIYAWGVAKGGETLSPVFKRSVVWGLVLTFVLTVITASFMAQSGGHFVGGNNSDAEGSIFFGWARDGGDLRPAHFFGLHAMHFVPAFGLVALALEKSRQDMALTLAMVGYVGFTAYVFIEALMGRPFLGGFI